MLDKIDDIDFKQLLKLFDPQDYLLNDNLILETKLTQMLRSFFIMKLKLLIHH